MKPTRTMLILAIALVALASCSGSNAADVGQTQQEIELALGKPTSTPIPDPTAPTPTPAPTEPPQATNDERLTAAVEVINSFYPDAIDIEIIDVTYADENQILINTCIWIDELDIGLTQHIIRVHPANLETETVLEERRPTETCTNQATVLDAAAHAQQVLNRHTSYLSGQGDINDVEDVYSKLVVDNWRDSAEYYLGDADHHLKYFPTTGTPVGYVATRVQNETMLAILLRLNADERAGFYLDETGDLANFLTNKPFTFDDFAGDEHVAGVLMERVDGAWKFVLWDDVDHFNCDGDCPRNLNRFNSVVGHVDGQQREPNFLYDFAIEENWQSLPGIEQ